MLNGLDSIDWAKVMDARGPATSVPAMLREIAGADAKKRKRALDGLADALNHQGTPTPAAVPAAPFVVELATGPALDGDGKSRAVLLALLGNLATFGHHAKFLLTGHDIRADFPHVPADHPAKQLYTAVAAGIDAYLALLASADDSERTAAAFVLAFLSREADRSLPAVTAQLAKEKKAQPKASLLLCLGYLARYLAAPADATFTKAASDKDALVQVAALLALAESHGGKLAAPQRDALTAHLDKAPKAPGFPWNDGDLHGFIARMATAAALADRDMPALGKLVEKTKNTPAERWVVAAMLDVAFAGPRPSDMRVPADLTDEQRAVLSLILAQGLTNRVFLGLASHGLPYSQLALERFLGGTPPGPLDAVANGEPLWRIAVRVLSDRAPESAFLAATKGLSDADLLALAEDIVLGSHGVANGWPYVATSGRGPMMARQLRAARLAAATLEHHASPAAISARADELLGKSPRSDAWSATLVLALGRPLAARGEALPERLDPLLLSASTEAFQADLRPLVKALPGPRREALVLALKPEHYPEITPGKTILVTRGAWTYADLALTPGVVTHLLAAMKAWNPKNPAPVDRAAEVLSHAAPSERTLLEAALPDLAGPARDAVEKALAHR